MVYSISCVDCGTRRIAREVQGDIAPFVSECRECGATEFDLLSDNSGD